MATTIVPKPAPVARGVKVKDVQKAVQTWLEYAQADLDKATDMLDAEFYAGQKDICQEVLWYLSVDPKVFRPQKYLYKSKLFALVPAAVVVTYAITSHRKDNKPDA